MGNRKEKAIMLKGRGCNCAQSVMLAYGDLVGVDEATMRAIGLGLGGGLGTTEGTCGAVIGACAVYGARCKDKVEAMKGSAYIINSFMQRNGATQCKLLKGIETGKPLRACPDCIADASEFLEDLLPTK